MSDLLKIKRGTLAQLKTYVPADGEPVYATDLRQLYVGNGTASLGVAVTGYLNSPMTIYVTPSGSATGHGLTVNDSVTPSRSLALASNYNWAKLGDMKINIGTGSYTLSSNLVWQNPAPLYIVGSPSNPALTKITTTYDQSYGGVFQVENHGSMYVDGFNIDTTAANNANNKNRGITSTLDSSVTVANIKFTGNWDTYIMAVESSCVSIVGDLAMSGVARYGAICADGKSTISLSPITTSLVSSPTITSFIYATHMSNVIFNGIMQTSGSGTVANKYSLSYSSCVKLNNTILPGTGTDSAFNLFL